MISDVDVDGSGLQLWNFNDKRLHKDKVFRECESIVQNEDVYIPEKVDQMSLESKGLVSRIINKFIHFGKNND